MAVDPMEIEALVFDVFGTVVDWRTSIVREGRALGERLRVEADWEAFANAWRGMYQPAMERVRSGEREWTRLDDLHRESLCALIESFGIRGLDEAGIDHFNRAWHRLDPWPDCVEGLTAMRRRYVLGNLLERQRRDDGEHGPPRRPVLGRDPRRRALPGPTSRCPRRTSGTCAYLDLPPERVVMVAAHNDDPRARRLPRDAHRVRRPPRRVRTAPAPGLRGRARVRLHRRDFLDLAAKLGCTA